MGSGNIIQGKWKKDYSDYYFCPNPEEFIFSHFPSVTNGENIADYTLLSGKDLINTFDEFNNLATVKRIFFKNNFISITPKSYNIEVDSTNSAQIIITFNTTKIQDKDVKLLCQILNKENNSK